MTETPVFQTKHKLDFYAAPWMGVHLDGVFWVAYMVGTVHGLYTVEEDCYTILAIANNEPGNGHLEDVFQWFENSCKRDGKNLKIIEFWNKRFYFHCLLKRGFEPLGQDLIKKI